MPASLIRIIIGTLVIIGAATFAARTSIETTYKRAALEVCDLIETYYFRSGEPEVKSFIVRCRDAAQKQKFLLSKVENIRRINTRLSMLRTSHLNLYRPDENRALWENRALDTGIRSRFVESDLIVHRVLDGSEAKKAGIQPGDVLLKIDGGTVSSPWDAQSSGGRYMISRRGDVLTFDLQPSEITEDMSPTLRELNARTALLRFPSFLSQYYEAESWKRVAAKLGRYEHIIIDLRDNAGGSFPAMLRALSPFTCRDRLIGELITSPERGGPEVQEVTDLRDVLDTRSQLAQLSEARRIRLRTFLTYGCYDGAATVLIDGGTSSTAEIFADAFFTRKNSRVHGQPSAGQVVMAQWFTVANFGGDDTSISIPIAGYVSSAGSEIENEGLRPEKLLYYDLERSRAGFDTWIDESVSK